jgi:methionyl-tRNA formyltransferase
MGDSMRVILISFGVRGFKVLYETCVKAGHTPVAYAHARSLRQRKPTSKGSAETIAAISESLPPGMDLLLPGDARGLARALAGYRPDLIVVYGLAWRLPREVRDVARLGAINVHTSLLPRHRGPLPVHWAVRNGETETGVSIHWMDDDFDTGNVLVGRGGVPIEEDLVTSRLWRDVDRLIGELLGDALELAAAGAPGHPQSEADASYAGWMEPDFMFVDWVHDSRRIHNQVRTFKFGLFGLRGPFARLQGEWRTLLRTSLRPADGVRVECADGPIWVVESAAAVPPDR